MIFVDDDNEGKRWPPTLHGTGTEDYFNTAWGTGHEEFDSPFFGLTLPGGHNFTGLISWYRWHLLDPVRFSRSIRVSIEHGHANRRSDDFSSTAYWYQTGAAQAVRNRCRCWSACRAPTSRRWLLHLRKAEG